MTEIPPLETVTEAMAFLAERGYSKDLVLAAGGVRQAGGTEVESPGACTIDFQFRFEGTSDPGNEDIVLGISLHDGAKGVVVSAYGKDTDPEHAEVLQALTRAS